MNPFYVTIQIHKEEDGTVCAMALEGCKTETDFETEEILYSGSGETATDSLRSVSEDLGQSYLDRAVKND